MHYRASLRRTTLTSLLSCALAFGSVAHVRAQSSEDADTAASKELAALTASYKARFGDKTELLVLDPDKLQAQPSWLDDYQRYNRLFVNEAAHLAPKEAKSLGNGLLFLSESSLYKDSEDKEVLSTFAAPAMAFPGVKYQFNESRRFCVVSPAHPDFQRLIISGLAHAKSLRFANRHEFWHCLQDTALPYDPRILEANAPFSAYVQSAQAIRDETRADMGAASDMIVYDGEATGIFELVAVWRQNRLKATDQDQPDIFHASGFALRALQKHIDAVGVDAWQKKTDQDRAYIIDAIIEDEALSPAALRDYTLALRGKVTLPTVDAKTALAYTTDTRARDTLNAARHLAVYRAATPLEEGKPVSLSPQQIAEIKRWNCEAEKRLTQAAGGTAMTVSSLARARSQLLDQLRSALTANPDDPLGGARIIVLDQAYHRLLTPALVKKSPPPSAQMSQPRDFSAQN